ncbi:MAG: hypothetical protein HOG49_30590 [Candidatus Scalindua sp.]|nr:hypothetical protein [Candidatus Scalindua sp.]
MKEVVLIVDKEDDDIKHFQDHILELDSDVTVESENDLSKAISKIREIIQRGDKVLCLFTEIIYRKNNDVFELKEQIAPYNAHLHTENDLLSLENMYYCEGSIINSTS